MKERPILFSGPMVRALLDGRKTQTRRVVRMKTADARFVLPHDGRWQVVNGEPMASHEREWLACPYGIPGDRLWVREAWRAPDGCECRESCHTRGHVYYEANADGDPNAQHNRLRPSIHMPRWASRISLEITEVRVERVQAISEADAQAEGVSGPAIFSTPVAVRAGPLMSAPCLRAGYAILWDSINAKRGYGWDVNPWVWALTFTVVTP